LILKGAFGMVRIRPGLEFPIIPEDFIAPEEALCDGGPDCTAIRGGTDAPCLTETRAAVVQGIAWCNEWGDFSPADSDHQNS